MLNGLDILTEICAPLNELMDNFADAVAERVIVKLKAAEADKPKYYTRKELCEMLHVTTPTIIELVKRGEICEKRIGGRILRCRRDRQGCTGTEDFSLQVAPERIAVIQDDILF